MEYHSAVKKNEIIKSTGKWMELEKNSRPQNKILHLYFIGIC